MKKLNNISIKKASHDDAANLANMLLRFDEETPFTMFQPNERSCEINAYEKKILDINNNSKSVIFLAVDNELQTNNIVGYITAENYKNNRKNHILTVGIGVLNSYYLRGLGFKLAIELIKHARKNGIRRIEACIAESNKMSLNLAKKFGMVIEGKKSKSICLGDTYQDEYLMALTLEYKQ